LSIPFPQSETATVPVQVALQYHASPLFAPSSQVSPASVIVLPQNGAADDLMSVILVLLDEEYPLN
jgi:hypothetical protein